MTLLGITIADTWLAWSQATGSKCTQSEFYNDLAEELIDNNCDRVGGTGSRQQPTGSENSPMTQNLINPRTGTVRAGISTHLTPTNTQTSPQHPRDLKHHNMPQCTRRSTGALCVRSHYCVYTYKHKHVCIYLYIYIYCPRCHNQYTVLYNIEKHVHVYPDMRICNVCDLT